MIVKNKKTQKEYEISENDWKKLVDQQLHRLFQIIKKGDVIKGKVPIPKEIIEFQKDPKRLKIETKK